jgi:hypothetical protein
MEISNIDQIISDVESISDLYDWEAFTFYKFELEWIKPRNLNIYAVVFNIDDRARVSCEYISPPLSDLLGFSAEELKADLIISQIKLVGNYSLMPIETTCDFFSKSGNIVRLWCRSIPGLKRLYIWGVPIAEARKSRPFEGFMAIKCFYQDFIQDEYDILRGLIESIGSHIRSRNSDLFDNLGYVNALSEQMRRFESTARSEIGLDLAHKFDNDSVISNQVNFKLGNH